MCVLADVPLGHHLPRTFWSAVAVPKSQRSISPQRPRACLGLVLLRSISSADVVNIVVHS